MGMKAGVSTVPRGNVRRPLRAPSEVASSSNFMDRILLEEAGSDPPAATNPIDKLQAPSLILRERTMLLLLCRLLQHFQNRIDDRMRLSHLNIMCRIRYDTINATRRQRRKLVIKGNIDAVDCVPMHLRLVLAGPRSRSCSQDDQRHFAVPPLCRSHLIRTCMLVAFLLGHLRLLVADRHVGF